MTRVPFRHRVRHHARVGVVGPTSASRLQAPPNLCSRRGSAMALNTSAIVGARGMLLLYSQSRLCKPDTQMGN
jgi:hypothetical protein